MCIDSRRILPSWDLIFRCLDFLQFITFAALLAVARAGLLPAAPYASYAAAPVAHYAPAPLAYAPAVAKVAAPLAYAAPAVAKYAAPVAYAAPGLMNYLIMTLDIVNPVSDLIINFLIFYFMKHSQSCRC